MMNLRQALIGAASLIALTVPAVAAETVKIAYIDPLSGGGGHASARSASRPSSFWPTTQREGRQSGKKFEIIGSTTRSIRRKAWSQAQKAIDAGIRIITQGNGSSVAAALLDFVAKYNERNPGKEMLYLNYAAVDPVLTNEKCSYWHFRWDANSDIKMEALTNYMKGAPEHQEGLSDQPGLLVRPGGAHGGRARCSAPSAPTSRSSATSCIRC